MEQDKGQTAAGEHPASDLPIVYPRSVLHSNQEKEPDHDPANTDKSTNAGAKPKKTYWKRLTEEGPDRHIELALAIVIAFFAGGQWVTSCKSSEGTTEQTKQLIKAAEISAHAAAHNAAAAQSFAESAQSINAGVAGAVGKLGDEVAASQNFATLTQQQFIKEQRPYMWHDSLVNVTFIVGEPNVVGLNVFYTNYGRSPALNFSSTGHVFCGLKALDDGYKFLERIEKHPKWENKSTVYPPVINPGLPLPNRDYDTLVGDVQTNENYARCAGPAPVLPRVAVGAWEYYDLAGKRYYGEFCNGYHLGIRRGYDADGNCYEHNRAD